MAIRIPSRLEVGQRVRWLRREADMTGRELATAISATDTGITTKIEKGLSFDYERLMAIATACAGKGALIEDDRIIFDFLLGFVDDPRVVLRPTLSLVSPVGEASSDTTDTSDGILYLRLSPPEQAIRDLQAAG